MSLFLLLSNGYRPQYQPITASSMPCGCSCLTFARTTNDCLIVAVQKLREHGYSTALLTNNFYIDKEKKLRSTPIDLSMFDVVVESALEGELKPEPRIYEITQEKLGTNNIIFLDDLTENLETARDLGWKTIHTHLHTELMNVK
uniref:HAD family hydrolase n=1 Tax=Heterorhabditis bacteriophora TaxID=37862 RepID=A0A1I7WQ02_HETBA